MNIFEVSISGLIQGLTEFLPISSSGHLVLLHNLFGLNKSPLIFDIFLHIGTLFSVCIFFFSDLKSIFSFCIKDNTSLRFILYLIIGSIPAGIIGILFFNYIKDFFSNSLAVGWMLIINGVWLTFTSRIGILRSKKRVLNTKSSLIIGISQVFALFPGISRSGSTIGTGLLLGIDRKIAVKFSFLLSIPVILGSAFLDIKNLNNFLNNTNWSLLMLGMFIAAISGYFAIKIVMQLVEKGKFNFFGIYCLIIGLITILRSM